MNVNDNYNCARKVIRATINDRKATGFDIYKKL